ncbi:unnamed protein product [Prorocentrum cordatum]|uniref:Uncharacterized protein n=1 Tax=Prorocentrum cordatum TaxID=2364126 RepID=A0ABN9XLY0_9DINO|nr:unnamed protein product [Polarella glacialis]
MTAASSSSTGGAFDPFGDPAAGCEPYWYQGYPSAYYGQSHVDFRRKCRDFVETEIKPYLDGWIERREAYPLSLHAKSLEAGLPTAGLAKDVQSRYPAAILPDGGFDPFHELIYPTTGSGGPRRCDGPVTAQLHGAAPDPLCRIAHGAGSSGGRRAGGPQEHQPGHF